MVLRDVDCFIVLSAIVIQQKFICLTKYMFEKILS